MSNYNDFINENIAPYASKKIGVYNNEGTKVGEVPLGNFKPTYGTRKYRFGLLSDVHNQESQTTENTEDLKRALEFFNQTESVEMTCICGDISYNGIAIEYQIFKNNVEAKSPDTPVYTCTGNHDATTGGLNNSAWQQYTGHERCFEITKNNDHFLFFSMSKWNLGDNGNPYLDEDISWLENKLEQYRNERCFVFTHLFLPDYAGNYKKIYASSNWLGGTQLAKITELVEYYKNAIWFSGHSHWKWYLQKGEAKANIYKKNGAWTVHVPSCAYPADVNAQETSKVYKNLESEGAIVDVYDDYIDIRGMDLKNLKYLPIAQYRLDTTLVTIPEKDINIPCTNITLNANTLSFRNKIAQTLVYTLSPSDTTDVASWSVNPTGVVSVSNGIVTPIGNGSATITATCGNQSATCAVNVELTSITTEIPLTWDIGKKIDSTTGVETTDIKYAKSNYISVNSNNEYKLSMNTDPVMSSTRYTNIKICYYDANKTFLSCSSDNVIGKDATQADKKINTIPGISENTKFIAIRLFSNNSGDTEMWTQTVSLTETGY